MGLIPSFRWFGEKLQRLFCCGTFNVTCLHVGGGKQNFAAGYSNIPLPQQVPGIVSHAWPHHGSPTAVSPSQTPRLQLQSREIQADSGADQGERCQPGPLQGSPQGAPAGAPCRLLQTPGEQARPQQEPPQEWSRTGLRDYRVYTWLSRQHPQQQTCLRLLRLHGLERLQGSYLLRAHVWILRQQGALPACQRELHRPPHQSWRRTSPT